MNVLMLGWEFPPYMSGGLGTACQGLARGLSELGVRITFVLPRRVQAEAGRHVHLVSGPRGVKVHGVTVDPAVPGAPRGVRFRVVNAALHPYGTPVAGHVPMPGAGKVSFRGRADAGRCEARATSGVPLEGLPRAGENYSGDLFAQLDRYVDAVAEIAAEESFDVVHAHDWMTFPAGAVAARMRGTPLVVHVHSTEFDRSGPWVNQGVCDVEREGMRAADQVIAVSNMTRQTCIDRYGVPPDKVEVVYNAVDHHAAAPPTDRIATGDKIVLFLGRITMQKGPEYFLAAAKKVLEKVSNVKFIMAGAGDLMARTVEMAAGLGLGRNVLFTGFLRGDEVERAYRMADLYVMPSVSEPFGIAPLEALANDVPVLISKQSGVAEVLRHVLKVDFWDVREMANKIIAVLTRPPLMRMLRENGSSEVRKFNWVTAAAKCVEVYRAAMARAAARWSADAAAPAPAMAAP